MSNIFSLFQNKKILFLLVLLVLVLVLSLTYKITEGFDMGSFDTSLGTSTAKDIPEQYKYLAPLPEGSVWTPEFQDKYIGAKNMKKEDLTVKSPLYGGKSLMEVASQKEAEYFLENGLWPYDDYVTNYLLKEWTPPQSATQIEQTRKMMPNRVIYNMISLQTVPQMKMLYQIGNYMGGENKLPNGKSWKCTKDGELQTKEEGGSLTASTDYSFFPNNITGFSYEGDPCNVCDITKIAWSKGGAVDYNAAYNSLENRCKFKMSGEIPEAYNVYIGKYGNAPSESSPASTGATSSGDEYQKCISSCDKFK